jgi:hypothetical protein
VGYFASGFAFDGAPDWGAVRSLFESFSIRGYQHKECGVCLLDVWRSQKSDSSRFPFTTGPISAGSISHPMPMSRVTDAFDEICWVLSSVETVQFQTNWLCIPLLLSSTTGRTTFAFTADDDSFDYGALASTTSLVRMGCTIGRFDIVLNNGIFSVTPCVDAEQEGTVDGDDELFAALTAIEEVRLLPPRSDSEGRLVYRHPSDAWPPEWGDVEQLLGFGTFDPFLNLTEDFEVVYEHLPARGARTTRPWWKLW